MLSLRVLFAVVPALLLLANPVELFAGLMFTLEMQQTEQRDGSFLYKYHLQNAPGDNLPVLSLCMEVGIDAALNEITGPPGWEIIYEGGGETADMVCFAGLFDFAWIPPGEFGDFSFVSPIGSTAENYYSVAGLSYDYEDSEGFEGAIATPFAPPYQPGDADGDRDVDLEDLNLVRNNFGAFGEGLPGDANGDNAVDLLDLNDVRNNFGAAAGAAAVPEPGSWIGTLGCLFAIAAVRGVSIARRCPSSS